MGVHNVAARGFGSGAGNYERGRPGYPAAAVELLRVELGLTSGRTVLDVAAGTGKLTRLLAASRARVLALEPVPEMRKHLISVLPEIELVDGVAEEIALAADSVDAVTVATAFHWFDGERALREFHRVLRVGGGLALVWNVQDETTDWVREVNELIGRAVETGSDAATLAKAEELERSDWRMAFTRTALFEPTVETVVRHVHEADAESQVARFLSGSFVAALPAEVREPLAAEITELLRTHPATRGRELLPFPYLCEIYCFRAD